MTTGPEVHSTQYVLGFYGLANYLEIDWDRFLETIGVEAICGMALSINILLNASAKYEDKKYHQIDDRDSIWCCWQKINPSAWSLHCGARSRP